MAPLEDKFNNMMLDLHHRMATETGFKSTTLLEMIAKNGGVGTAKQLLNAPRISDGYAFLVEKGRLDLTVEAIVLDNPQFHGLFSDKELATAKRRLGK